MNSWNPRANEIFLEAIEKSCSFERRAYIDDVCRDDFDLRKAVDSLLLAHNQADGFLVTSPMSRTLIKDLLCHAGDIGKRFGPYRISGLIGHGGMGTVYLAEQMEPIRRTVALKVIKLGMDTPRLIARFEVERQAVAMMDHPNIASIYDAAMTDDGRPYFVMELVNGPSITEYCDEVRLTISERLDLFIQVCRAVQHAHERGIIHRDLKPSNILITIVDGKAVPKVIDFGIAKFSSGLPTGSLILTQFEEFVGTPVYTSPEQISASNRSVDMRSDVYVLGILLYELLTGTTPIEMGSAGKHPSDNVRGVDWRQGLQSPSDRLSSLNQNLADVSAHRQVVPIKLIQTLRGDLDWIVLKALEFDSRSRYQSALEFAQDISNYLRSLPLKTRAISKWSRIKKTMHRHRSIATTTGIMSFILILGLFILSRQAYHVQLAEVRRTEASRQIKRQDQIQKRLLYDSHLRLAQQQLSAGQIESAQEALEQLRPAVGEPDLRSFEWFYLHHLSHRNLSRLVGHKSPVYAVSLSPDGKTLVSGDLSGLVIFWDLSTWNERGRVQAHKASIRSLLFAPDGRTLVSTSGGDIDKSEIKLWDVTNAQKLAIIPGMSGDDCDTVNFHQRPAQLIGDRPNCSSDIAFSHDGETLLVFHQYVDDRGIKQRVNLWSVSPTDQRVFPGEVSKIASGILAISPNHKLIVTLSKFDQLDLRDASTGQIFRTILLPDYLVYDACFTTDGKKLLVRSQHGLTFFDASSGEGRGGFCSDWAPHSRMLKDSHHLTGSLIQSRDGYWVPDSYSEIKLRYLEPPLREDLNFLLSPDRKTIAGAGILNSIVLWNTATGEKIDESRYPTKAPRSLAFAQDGQSLFFGTEDGDVGYWRRGPSTQPLENLRGHEKEVWAIAFTPNGNTLISGSDDHTIRLWNVLSGELVQTLIGHESLVSTLAISPDGKILASGSFDKTIRLWDLKSGRLRAILSGHTDRVRSVAFSPNNRLLATCATDRTVRVWDIFSGKELQIIGGFADGLHDLTFSPDGSRLVIAGNDGTLSIRDLNNDSNSFMIHGNKSAKSVVFSNDGSVLASGSSRGDIRIFDSRTWSKLFDIKASDSSIQKLCFSPDGQTLASASSDGKIRLWDSNTGQLTLNLDGHLDRVNAVVFSHDGSILASASHDGAIKLWQTGKRRHE